MEEKLLKLLREKLEKEKAKTKEQLEGFAKRDSKIPENWKTRFPKFNGESGGAALERAADEVEEYQALLPVEYTLETKLREINLALEKIKKGEYGICENCKKKIPVYRLKIYPQARLCLKCERR